MDSWINKIDKNKLIKDRKYSQSYQDSLIEGQMMEKVVDYYENTLVSQMKEINSSESFDWKDPANRYFMLQQLFAEGNLKDPAPSLKKAIGLAYVSKEMKDSGTEIYIAVRNKQLKAKVVSLPFYKK